MSPLDAFRLDGRTVVVTGASSGLGSGFARALGAVGARVVLAARRADRLADLAAELEGQGTEVLVHATDVTSPDACATLVEAAMARFGSVDVLVNCAGVGGAVTALKETPEHFRGVVDTNLHGTYWMAQACGRVMQPGSAIVNVSSVHGLRASRFPQAAYAASKAGVLGLTRDLAQQWTQRRGIRVNALAPGYFASEMTTDGEAALQDMVARHALIPRFGRQEELDGALLFLASPASSYVTGTTVVVDGGLSVTV
ncbi:SDR family NAD(P)-dependent oxidoreductase [Nocardioides pacificus]